MICMSKAYNPSETGPGGLGNLRRLAYFVAVVETGSFTAAAERLGITKAVVSQQVARLEQEFRTSLLVRTTRKVQATDAGRAFYERCASILHEADDAFTELAEASTEPAGKLRLTAPFDYGVGVVVPAIAAFTLRYPGLQGRRYPQRQDAGYDVQQYRVGDSCWVANRDGIASTKNRLIPTVARCFVQLGVESGADYPPGGPRQASLHRQHRVEGPSALEFFARTKPVPTCDYAGVHFPGRHASRTRSGTRRRRLVGTARLSRR
jgi:molybdenum-dependent DNA-binding transcriptional regulator ModE